MALVPRDVFRNWWDDMDRFHREVEDHFRQLSVRDDTWRWPTFPSFRNMFRPWRDLYEGLDREVGGSTTIERDYDKYQLIVDVRQFAPEEVTVRTDDKYVTVEGKHEEKKDRHGYISRQFLRRYMLPKGYDINYVKPNLSSDGILTITAPRLALLAHSERIVPIRRSRFG